MKVEKGDSSSPHQLSIRNIEGDMGEETRMDLIVEQDGDVILGLRDPNSALDINFNTNQGGSHNPEISKALRDLARNLAGEGFPEAPRQYTVITGEDHIMEEQTTIFFNEILSVLGYDNQPERSAFCRIELFSLGKENRETDGMFRILVLEDRTVGSVFLRRNQFNNNEVSFATYLNPQLVEQVRFRRPISDPQIPKAFEELSPEASRFAK